MPVVLNAANEAAVEAFLEGHIGFLQIPMLIEKAMEAHEAYDIDHIETVMKADSWARHWSEEALGGLRASQ
jgi:1-deoxy-D-xylulose-5-phosphate reductoisomerase